MVLNRFRDRLNSGVLAALIAGFLVLPVTGQAAERKLDPASTCLDAANRSSIEINTDQVETWITSSKNQFRARAWVKGFYMRPIRSRSTHEHFEIRLGDSSADTIEIVYNREFGELPSEIEDGAEVEICGDYITTGTGKSGSPTGAIIHWVHFNPGDRDGGKHPHGYVKINGRLYGDQGDYLTQRVSGTR